MPRKLPKKNKDQVPLWLRIIITILILGPLLGQFINSKEVIKGETDNRDNQPRGEESQDSVISKRTIQTQAIENYLRDYNGLYSHLASDIVDIANKWGVDPYLLVAIFIRESSAGHACFNDFNCFGFGNYYFSELLYGFDSVAEALAGSGENGFYYENKTTWEKLRTYNSVIEEYPEEVLSFVEEIKSYENQ